MQANWTPFITLNTATNLIEDEKGNEIVTEIGIPLIQTPVNGVAAIWEVV